MLQHETLKKQNICVIIIWLRVSALPSTCTSLNVGCYWFSSWLTARLLSQQGFAVQPLLRMRVSFFVCLCLSHDKAASLCVPDCVYSAICVQSPVGMGHWEQGPVVISLASCPTPPLPPVPTLISRSHSYVHSEVLCESLHSVFPSDRICFPSLP